MTNKDKELEYQEQLKKAPWIPVFIRGMYYRLGDKQKVYFLQKKTGNWLPLPSGGQSITAREIVCALNRDVDTTMSEKEEVFFDGSKYKIGSHRRVFLKLNSRWVQSTTKHPYDVLKGLYGEHEGRRAISA